MKLSTLKTRLAASTLLPLGLSVLLLGLQQTSCDNQEVTRASVSQAQRITSATQLIGGPSARAEIGDYIMQNDHVRVVVQDLNYNRGSGVFGGSLIDADIIRPNTSSDLLGGSGQDTFGEMFPAFFLEVVEPEEIEVLNDGSDGKAAIIEVRGKGGEFVSMARMLNQVMINSYNAQENLSRILTIKPPILNQDPQLAFSVRYILEPDARHVKIESELRNISLKKLEFPNSSILSALTGALGIDLGDFTVPAGHVLGFGKLNSPFLPGIGYDIQFGLEDAYERPINLPALPGHRTPILATSSNHGVSYGYAMDNSPKQGDATITDTALREHFVYAKDQIEGENGPLYGGDAKPGDMLFLFYASGFGGAFTHQLPPELAPSFCTDDPNLEPEAACNAYVGECDGEDCEKRTNSCLNAYERCREQIDTDQLPSSYTFTSYLLIGDGDVSSLWDELYDLREEKTQTIQGTMIDAYTGQAAGRGESMLIYEARKTTQDPAQQCAPTGTGLFDDSPYLLNQVHSQRGGTFRFKLPPGVYCYRTHGSGREIGPYVRFVVEEGKDLLIEPALQASTRVEVQILDEAGSPIPGRVTVVGTHPMPEGEPDSPRKFLFELRAGEHWRITDMVPDKADDPSTRQYIEHISYADGSGLAAFDLRSNGEGETYTVYLSRGPEYDPMIIEDVVAKPGETLRLAGKIKRTMDTKGFLSGDYHLHARGSIDSGLDYNDRIISLAGEGLEIAVSSDHNYISDYKPYIQGNNLQDYINSVVGLELTTFEAGHFNGFPLRYELEFANRGSFEWQQQPPGLVFEEMRQRGTLGADNTIIQVNHPRDSILGYFSQHNVDALNTTVTLPFETEDASVIDAVASVNGPAFYEEQDNGEFKPTFSWNFDAIEVFNGKRFELLRHFRATKEDLLPLYEEYHYTNILDDDSDYSATQCENARARLLDTSADPSCPGNMAATECQEAQATVDDCNVKENAAQTEANRLAVAHLAMINDKDSVIVCSDNEVAFPGHLDDWYNLLNNERSFALRDYEEAAIPDGPRKDRYRKLYKKYTATGNSDSHSAEFDDPGYPRNYFYVGHDDPAQFTSEQLVEALQAHRNVVSNGPLVNMTINEEPIGSELSVADGKVTININVSSSSWNGVDRWRLIANGEVVQSGDVDMSQGDGYSWSTSVDVTVSRDTWFVVEVEGDQNMFPLLAPGEIPPFDIQSAIGSLAGPFGFGAGEDGLEPDLTFPIHPFAFTNPIWVIADGDGEFNPINQPQLTCSNGVVDVGEIDPGAIQQPRTLGKKRLDALNVPFKVGHDKPLNSRIKGEVKDVRVIFEAWGHMH